MSRVMVADDHPVFRKGLVALLKASGHEVVGEASDGNEAIAIALAENPEVVLMDLGMPGLGGVAATGRLTAERPDIRVVVITLFDDEQSVRAALEAGAHGYVVKQSSPEQILDAVQAVLSGARWLGTGVPLPGMAGTAAPVLTGLTPREAAVADLLGRGLGNPAIAERLGLSTKTVANYVSSVLLKLGVDDRAEAGRVVRGMRAG